jgi:uncharacterized protein (TIGR00369 family)
MIDSTFDIEPLKRLNIELERPPFNVWIGARAIKADPQAQEIQIVLPFRQEFSHHPTIPLFHGGIVSALIDIAGHAAVAVWHRAPTPTISLHIEFLSPAQAPELHARGFLRRLGRSLAFSDIEVTDAAARKVALGRGVFKIRGGSI